MKVMHQQALAKQGRLLAAGLSLMALCACSALRPTPTPPPAFYALDNARVAAPVSASTSAPAATPTLIINPAHAASGFDSPRIIYVREPHKLEYFAHSEWVDPPARMLGPLLVAAIESTGAFRAVVLTPGAAAGDLRLDTEIIRLQHEFQTGPSRVRFTLRATLVDDKTRRVLAWHEFDAAVPAASEDPYGGVVAANRAVQTVLQELSNFCAETARSVQLER
jgi:cholesterol transport system auxiliary component